MTYSEFEGAIQALSISTQNNWKNNVGKIFDSIISASEKVVQISDLDALLKHVVNEPVRVVHREEGTLEKIVRAFNGDKDFLQFEYR